MFGTLYIVATPIGNLEDASPRMADVLRSVDVVACEDTRHTRKLLNHFNIKTRTVSNHEHNEKDRAEELLERLHNGESVALVSDAGTPGISDPGFRLASRAHDEGIRVISIPGPVAFAAAVAASGIAADAIFFGGFLPGRKGERLRRLDELKTVPATLVFYEAPHRIRQTLADCIEALGDRTACIAREISKMHEEITRAPLSELIESISPASLRGEIVLVIERAAKPPSAVMTGDALAARVREIEAGGADHKAALKAAAKEFGVPKSEAYRLLEITKK